LSKKLKKENNCVSGFDESLYGFARMTIHSPTNSRNPKFQILGSKIFER
jgi:hypothetical protein